MLGRRQVGVEKDIFITCILGIGPDLPVVVDLPRGVQDGPIGFDVAVDRARAEIVDEAVADCDRLTRKKLRAERIVDWHAERSEEQTSELQSLMRISYAVFCLKK